MHFPWKKAKVTRISRLVAGLHQSPKRGGSLVVETGFPTSLIDLFVKNRDRLRKSSKKKSGPQILIPSPPCNEELQTPDMDDGELVIITRAGDDEKIGLHLVFKISLMVALAVSTRNLAVWIMMAALLLAVIEFVGTHFLGFLRPQSKTLFFESWIRKGLKSRADELVEKQQGTDFPDPCEVIELKDEIRRETAIITCKSEHSRSARFKTSLIKKFVPKKLRHEKSKKQGKSNKKKDKESSNQVANEEDESETGEDQVLQVESEPENVRKRNSGTGYVVLLVMVILAGLTGGRGVALLLSLVCCFILIYIATHQKTKMTLV
ncbi:uncharacterized protein LOC108485516 [Gossypium arboreum]|uniref:Uncharacterized protein n=1 Tax=Gossypium arboreum TaxID=29729 RepID=A0ABR0PMX1_GOSAR|nr:uncharacterized protein LOC108485516 [Gossypium arboreum]KAK5825674.1 hypothetical protein PVK06_020532 [Gossypium arboreum]